MSKKEKLIMRLLGRPKDFHYDEAKVLLGYFGFVETIRAAHQDQELNSSEEMTPSCSISHILPVS